MRKKIIAVSAAVLLAVLLFCLSGGETVATFMGLTAKKQAEKVILYPYFPACGMGLVTEDITDEPLGQAVIELLFDRRAKLRPSDHRYFSETETRSAVYMTVVFTGLPEDHPYRPNVFLSVLEDGTVVVDLTTSDEYRTVLYEFALPGDSPVTYKAICEEIEG